MCDHYLHRQYLVNQITLLAPQVHLTAPKNALIPWKVRYKILELT